MSIPFADEAHKARWEHVARLLAASDPPFTAGADGAYFFRHSGNASVRISVPPGAGDDALISVAARVVMGANVGDPALLRHLLDQNMGLTYGCYGVDDAGDICLSHAVLASECDQRSLEEVAAYILETAARADDEITTRWGGRPFLQPKRVPGPPGFPRISKDPDTGVLYIRDLDVTIDQFSDVLRANDEAASEAFFRANPDIQKADLQQVEFYLEPHVDMIGARHLGDLDVAALRPPS